MKKTAALLVLALAASCSGDSVAPADAPETGASGAAEPVHLASPAELPAELPRFIPDDGWRTVPPSKGMRLHQYEVPGAAGAGRASGEVVVAAWPQGVGGLEANLSRWIRQSGMNLSVEQLSSDQLSRRNVRGFEVSILRLEGASGAGDAASGAHGAAGQALTVAYIEKPGHPGVWTVKLTGPIETIQAQGAAFDAFLDRL